VSFVYDTLNAGLAFIALFLIFRPLERAFPAKADQRFFRPHWWTDCCFLLGQYLLFNGVVFWLLQQVEPRLRAATPAGLRAGVAALAFWQQAVLVVVLGDILIYWGHRLQHRVGFLWRFHAVHHSSEHLDWLAAHREHPVDSVYTILLVNLPIFALGFPLSALATFAAFRGIWAVFIHSNVRVRLGPLGWILGAPALHHWHHARVRQSGNYANVSPLMDVLFGTYRCPDHEPPNVGLAEPFPRTYLGQLAQPLRWRKFGTTSVPKMGTDVPNSGTIAGLNSLPAAAPRPRTSPAPPAAPGTPAAPARRATPPR
jgi:sterol desaturase/sphingolipid hydroxylase (fatty acid hydroxylase superfamily)